MIDLLLLAIQGVEPAALQFAATGIGGAGGGALGAWLVLRERVSHMEKRLDGMEARMDAGFKGIQEGMERASRHRSQLHTEVEVIKSQVRGAGE